MSAAELLELYGIADYTGQTNQGTANTDFRWLGWIEGDYECTEPGTGVLKRSLWFDEYCPWESPTWGICFRYILQIPRGMIQSMILYTLSLQYMKVS